MTQSGRRNNVLQSIIHGKLPSSVWNSEDVITSSIVGGFQYLSDPLYIIQVLCASVNLGGDFLAFPKPIEKVQYKFWPSLKRCEPDVVLILIDEDAGVHIVSVEAKYLSPKSSEEDETVDFEERKTWQRDQLSRELEDLNDLDTSKKLSIDEQNIVSRQLIYLTNDTVMPKEDMLSGVRHSKATNNNVYWLNWASFYEAACMEPQTIQDDIILAQIREVCDRKNLTRFHGWGTLSEILSFEGFYSSNTELAWPEEELVSTSWKYNTEESSK